jgi:hypothetical protein
MRRAGCPAVRINHLLFSAAVVIATAISSARAQDYPARPVEMIVPFAAGGGSELLARLLADGLAKRLGQPFVVVNRPGANTNLGTFSVVRAKADGYTLLIASVGLAANPSLYKKLAFEPQRDLEPITLIANSPTVLAVPPSLPVNSLAEFIAYAKARPGELNYASYGVGSGPHLATELFCAITGVKMVHVPYGGGGPAAVGAMSNQVQALFFEHPARARDDPQRDAQSHRARVRPPLRAPAGRAHFQGGRARLSHRHLVRAARAGADAARDRRRAQPRGGVGAAGARRARTARRARRRGDRQFAGGIPRLHPQRDRAIGGRDPRREHRARLSISLKHIPIGSNRDAL